MVYPLGLAVNPHIPPIALALCVFVAARPALAGDTPPGLRGAADVSLAALGWRPASGGDFAGTGMKLTLGQGRALVRGPVGVTSIAHGTLRILEAGNYSFSPLGWGMAGHVYAGPISFSSGFGASFFTVDYEHGAMSVGMLSPRVLGAVGYHFGHHTLEARTDVEYDARFLQPDRVFVSLGIALRVEVPVP